MANLLYANNAVGTLASGITNTATSLTLNAGQASLFPAPSAPQVFYATITDAATQTLIEIVQVTAVSGNIFSLVRAQDGTSALSWNQNDIVSQRTIALELRGFENAAEGLFGATGNNAAITPSTTLGIVGTILGDNANAGAVGEYIASTVLPGSATALTTNVPTNVTSIVLTPGDWDVSGNVNFNNFSTGVTWIQGGISNVSGTPLTAQAFILPGLQNSQASISGGPVATVRYNLTANTTIYLVAASLFSNGGMSAYGFIAARRVR